MKKLLKVKLEKACWIGISLVLIVLSIIRYLYIVFPFTFLEAFGFGFLDVSFHLGTAQTFTAICLAVLVLFYLHNHLIKMETEVE